MSYIARTAVANKNKELHAWYEKITDQKFNCPAPIQSELDPGNDGQPILKVVDCDDPSATYRYDYKVNLAGRRMSALRINQTEVCSTQRSLLE